MKISYDPRHKIAYIRLREKPKEVETIRISDEVNVDISPDGKVCGIELLNANEQLQIIEGPVATVVGMVADGMSEEQILSSFPDLEHKDIQEALQYASEAVREREIPLVKSACIF